MIVEQRFGCCILALLASPFCLLEFFRQPPDCLVHPCRDLRSCDTHIMLHFAFAQVVQMWNATADTVQGRPPHAWTEECVRRPRNPSLAGPSCSPFPLHCERSFTSVVLADRTAVDSHAHPQSPDGSAVHCYLYRAGNWGVRRCRKDHAPFRRPSAGASICQQHRLCGTKSVRLTIFIERMQINRVAHRSGASSNRRCR